jgi:hypothetical protein
MYLANIEQWQRAIGKSEERELAAVTGGH